MNKHKHWEFFKAEVPAGTVILRFSPSDSDWENGGEVSFCWIKPNSSSHPNAGEITDGQ
jgi:hypothetical protein